MARRMETKSARILALILALIMLGSVLTYAIKGTNKTPEREIKFEMEKDFYGCLKYLPAGARKIIYMDSRGADEIMLSLIHELMNQNLNPYMFQHIRFTGGMERMLVANYPYGILYFIDVNKSKVYFSYDVKEDYLGYTIKMKQGVALAGEISPLILGTPMSVAKAIEAIEGITDDQFTLLNNYTKRLPSGNYNLVIALYGEAVEAITQKKFIDFYIAGYRMNGSMYEKVVGVHFLSNGFFTDSNLTTYYSYTNYDDGFSVAIMSDANLTKLFELQPEMRLIEIVLE